MKKTIKKLAALLGAAAMVVGLTLSAGAASIQVQNVVDNEVYDAYKILNYSDNGKTGAQRVVSYYLTADQYTAIGSVLEAAGFEFTASSDGTQYFVSNGDTIDAAAVAAYLGEHTTDLGNALAKAQATGAGGEAQFNNLDKGYYFVTSTVGSLCALHEDTDIETLVEKNTVPSIDKKERIKQGENFVDGPLNGNIGDTVYYQIIVTDGVGTDAELTVTDTLSSGLDYTTGTLKINGASVADNADTADWKVTVAGRKITIVFSPAFVKALDTDGTITINLDATINENAVINSPTNENKVELDYSNQHSEDKVYVTTYDFQVKKTDGTQFLDGAEFKLYDALTDGNQILLSKDGTGYYRDDTDGSPDTTIDINTADGCNVRGLEPGDYYLEEVVVPNGYNKLAQRQKVTVVADKTETVEITVINEQGTELPSTGGMGTTIFYVIGGILILAAAIILISRRRVQQ